MENKRKEMVAQLAKAIEDWIVFEEILLIEQEQVSDLFQDLAILQKQRRTTDERWSEEVNQLRGQLFVQY